MWTPVDKPERGALAAKLFLTGTMFTSAISSCSKSYLVLEERARGLTQIRVVPWSGDAGALSRIRRAGVPGQSQRQFAIRYDHDALRVHVDENAASRSTITIWRRGKQHCSSKKKCWAVSTPDDYVTERLYAPRRRWHGYSALACCIAKGMKQKRRQSALLYGYGSYGVEYRCGLRVAAPEFGRSRLCLRDRARSRRPGDGAPLVRGRQAAEEEKHLHRFHRLRRIS